MLIAWLWQPSGIARAAPAAVVYGHSVQGRALVYYTFGSGPNTTLIIAATHGNERNTRPLAEKLIVYLEANPNAYDGCTVWVIPCVNPDGWAASTRVNANLVDLNRNYPIGWKPSDKAHLKRGTRPLSEPEAASLAVLIIKLHPQKIVSIHNPLHMLDFAGPKGIELAKVIADKDGYPIPTGGVGYPTPGSFGAYAAKECVKAIVTIELPRESIAVVWKENRDAILTAIKFIVNG